MKNKITLLYVTYPNDKSAKTMATQVLNNKLAACANLFNSNAIYHWEDKLESKTEKVIVFKTSNSKVKRLKKMIIDQHPYDCPCVISFKAKVNKSYYRWLKQTIN